MRRVLGAVFLVILLAAVSYGATRLVVRKTAAAGLSACPAFGVLQDYLGLTPEQRDKLASVDAQFAAVRPQLRSRVWETRDDLIATLQDPNSTRAQAVEKAREFCAAQQAIQINTVEYITELRQHLTPAQQQKLAGLVGRGMCALTGGPCGGRGAGRGSGGGMGLGMGGRGRGNGCCGPAAPGWGKP